jgi:hypothetical protein
MRAVIIGTDFMKDTDGTFKALETNTNIQLDTQWSLNFDSTLFENFVLSNNFTEVVLISNDSNKLNHSFHTINEETQQLRNITKNNIDNSLPFIKFHYTLESYLKSFLTESSIQLTTITTDVTSTTIPFVEDSDSKLIIRISYDTTALIDDYYARDNWGFLRLMYDADNTSIPKCYINDEEFGIDSIGDTLIDNGNHPNYCIKKRVTPSNNKIYPKLFKLSTSEQLNDLKSNLEVDEYIQEYIFNTDDLFEGRLNTYRSIDLVYGSNLDIINLQVVEKTKNLPVLDSADFDDTNQVQHWDRMRYLQKFYTSVNEIAIQASATDDTKILLPNGTTKLAKSLQLGDEVKTLSIPNIPDSDVMGNLDEWSTSYDSVINDYQLSSTFLEHEAITTDYYGILVTFNTEVNTIFSDLGQAKIMMKDGENVKFERYVSLKIGDEVLIYDTNISQLITTTITDVNFRFDKFTADTLDFEEIDWFITMEETENQSRYGLITHNYDYDCYVANAYSYGGPTYFNFQYCNSGGIAYIFLNDEAQTYVCAKYYYGPGGTGIGVYGDGGYELFGICNSQKSDIQYKENIHLVGVSNSGLNIYEYNYKNKKELYQGVIAQELIGTNFENALSLNIDGLYEVDYNKIDVEFKKLN